MRSPVRYLLIVCWLPFVGCPLFPPEPLPTGVQTRILDDGSIELIVTGRASSNAIDKDSTAMKQTTSREAARLLLEAELQSGRYPDHGKRFTVSTVEFEREFEYCIMKGIYKKP
ncbi:MAG: hypothetical protein KDK33_05575 [Leptospiraceae bacterium]|nr:hypothetical protein [Leptospiraceae bacterium]